MNFVWPIFFSQEHADDFVAQEVEHSGSHNISPVDHPIDTNVTSHEASDGFLDGNVGHEISIQDGTSLPVVTKIHSSTRIQQDLELWRRIKEYDQKAAEDPFTPVLTRK